MRAHILAPFAFAVLAALSMGCITSTLSPAEAPVTVTEERSVAADDTATPAGTDAPKPAASDGSKDASAQSSEPAPPPGQYEMSFTPTSEPPPAAAPKPRKGSLPPPTTHKKMTFVQAK